MRWLTVSVLSALGCLGMEQLPAQVVIYRISFEDLGGYNVDFYDGGYLIAPALGGLPALTLVNREPDGTATYTSAVSGGDFFIGLDGEKRLMATYSCRGSGDAALCAFGEVGESIRLKSHTFDIQVRIAGSLSGGVVAASGEGGEKGPDGTIGFAQHCRVTMEVDTVLTEEANILGGEPGDGVSVVNAYLESHGFRPEDPVPDDTGAVAASSEP